MNKYCSSYNYSTANVMELITAILLLAITAIIFQNITKSTENIQ